MSNFQQKDMSGSLFKNDRREKDTHPHATGTALIDGVAYWVSAWTKDGAKGKFQSLSFKRKEERAAEIRSSFPANSHYEDERKPRPRTEDMLDDDLPF